MPVFPACRASPFSRAVAPSLLPDTQHGLPALGTGHRLPQAYAHVYTHAHIYAHTGTHKCVHAQAHKQVHANTRTHLYCTCVHAHTHTRMCAHTCVRVCVHTHTHTSQLEEFWASLLPPLANAHQFVSLLCLSPSLLTVIPFEPKCIRCSHIPHTLMQTSMGK